jgi:hypothetical protein
LWRKHEGRRICIFSTLMFERRVRMCQSLWMKELRFSTKDLATSTWRVLRRRILSQPYFGWSGRMKLPLPKVGDLESSGTLERLEFDNRGQNTSHWCVLGVIGKVLKCRCPKCPRIGHLNICSPSYGQKKGRESNWQFDSRPLKVGNRPLPDIIIGSATWRWKALKESYNFGLDLILIRLGGQEIWAPKVLGLQPGQFRVYNLGVPGKKAIWM